MRVYIDIPNGLDGFPARLRYISMVKGISQADICKACGISTHTMSFWFTGKTEPRLKALCILADTLGVSTDWLLGRETHEDGFKNGSARC